MYFSMHQLVEKADMMMTVINLIMTIGSGDYIYVKEYGVPHSLLRN